MTQPEAQLEATWQPTACILCECNCGIEVRLDGRRFERIRGDKAHPGSAGYTCEKALRLDHYQNGPHRLTSPLRRRPDGSYEEVGWETAIAEVAARLVDVRDRFGGETIFYYGGGGQGNHLGGAYSGALLRALGSRYRSNALAQEKTGEFWVDGKMYGGHTRGEFEHAEVAVFVGKNPWMSHSFPRARTVLKAIAADPARSLVVIDPRRTETAELADHFLQVKPGTDAWALAALVAVIVQEGLVDKGFVAARVSGFDAVTAAFGASAVDVDAYAARAGLAASAVRAAARRIATATGGVSVFEDLGVQQAPHSTLSSYLEKLLWVLTGNYAKPGAMAIHSSMVNLAGGSSSGGGGRVSPVVGARIIGGLVPANVIAEEILTDHPARYRAMIVESGNPAHSLADSPSFREAFAALEFTVVIDVAMTETARLADYVLPAASQFEKWEATFFNFEFPVNTFHLRAPLMEALPGTLPEPEIHARLVKAMGAVTDEELEPLRSAARDGRAAFADAFFAATAATPMLGALAPVVLYETLGPTLPDGAAAAAALWGAAHRCAMAEPDAVRRAGHVGEGLELGEALFDAVLAGRSGMVFSVDEHADAWRRVRTPEGRINVEIPELLAELAGLSEPAAADPAFPFVLSAGERRSFTANTIYRDPAWRKKDAAGALRMSPSDASALGLADGDKARVTTRRGSAVAVVAVTDTLQPGHVTLPNGLGVDHPVHGLTGVAPNELTSAEDRDWLAGTPHHKHVAAAVTPA